MAIEFKRVATIPKGAKAVVVSTYHIPGRGDYVDIRQFYSDGEMENVGTKDECPAYKPTKKGVGLPQESLPELIVALTSLTDKDSKGGKGSKAKGRKKSK